MRRLLAPNCGWNHELHPMYRFFPGLDRGHPRKKVENMNRNFPLQAFPGLPGITPPRIPSFPINTIEGESMSSSSRRSGTKKKKHRSVRTLSSSHSSDQEPHIEHKRSRGRKREKAGLSRGLSPRACHCPRVTTRRRALTFGPGRFIAARAPSRAPTRFGGRCSVRLLITTSRDRPAQRGS